MEKIWVWLKHKTIAKALEALLKAGDDEHQLARVSSGAQAHEHRTEAEEFHAAKADLWTAQHSREQPSMRNCSDDSVHGNSAPVQTVRGAPQTQTVNLSEKALAIIAFGFAIAAFVVALWANSDNTKIREEVLRSERESRVLQQQVMDQSALLLREGIRQPADLTNGPAGNLNYHRKEK